MKMSKYKELITQYYNGHTVDTLRMNVFQIKYIITFRYLSTMQ